MSMLAPINSEYLSDAAFFLTVGEQAPFKSVTDVWELTPNELKYWIGKLSDLYEKQQEELKKARRK